MFWGGKSGLYLNYRITATFLSINIANKNDILKIKNLCDRYYKNPPINYDDILNAHLHSIYLINIDKGFAKELDPQGYVELTAHLLGRSDVNY